MKYFSAAIPAYFAKFKGILVIDCIYIIFSRTKHFHSKMTYSNFENIRCIQTTRILNLIFILALV